MAVRLKGASRGFRNGGLELDGSKWTAFESLTDEQRETLRKYHGSHIKVFPDDVANLKQFGLAVDETKSGPLVDLTAKPTGGEQPTEKKSNSSKTATVTAATKEK